MDEREFKERTMKLALRVIRLVEALPKTAVAQAIGRQLLRSGTSIGANYRAACRARSKAEVIARLSIVEEEADESMYWLDLLVEANIVPREKLASLMREMNEILAMTVASIKRLRISASKSKIQNPKSKISKDHG